MGRTVLVVDDDVHIREALIDVLEDCGFRAIGAANGAEALDRLQREGRPSLILLDLMMPVMDGIEFRRLQLGSPEVADIPVVVLSAHRDPDGLANELRPAALLRKPVRLPELIGAVGSHCR